jgi:hypothetical protein
VVIFAPTSDILTASVLVGTDVQNLKIGSQVQITYNEMMSMLGVMNIRRGTDPRTWW